MQCANGSICFPHMEAEEPHSVHNFTCSCRINQSGRFCNHSSVLSFSGGGYLQLMSLMLKNVSFEFRTIGNNSLLMAGFSQTGIIVALQIDRCNLKVIYYHHVLRFIKPVCDGRWHAVNISVVNGLLQISSRPVDDQFTDIEYLNFNFTEISLENLVLSDIFFGGLDQQTRLLKGDMRYVIPIKS